MRRASCSLVEAEAASDLDDLAVHGEDGAERAEIDREGDADRDQRDLRGFEDAEPQDEQRHPGDGGNGAQALQRRVEQRAGETRGAGERAEQRAGGDAEGEARRDAGQRGADVQREVAVPGEVGQRGEDRARGRQQPPLSDAEADGHFPGEGGAERQGEAEQRALPALKRASAAPHCARAARGRRGSFDEAVRRAHLTVPAANSGNRSAHRPCRARRRWRRPRRLPAAPCRRR